ncbi:MAG: hypothetical protein B6D68_03100 [spirochete symbiont of Stewartia floridana]|nr:MAG: hypothetical protein B6D68_03100 [spirochete symbiont of Stewartia floridana]
MKIALFHYHLKPGGVTEVIVHSVRAILPRMPKISEIRLVTGSEDGTNAVMSRIREGMDRVSADKIKLDILSEVAYVSDGEVLDIDSITRRLKARYDEDTLWWIHNYHLGKNPYFTAALMKTAASGHRNILLHIHDFPECGRIDNQLRLDKTLDSPAYPTGPRIRYAVINERDRRMLSDAGMEQAVTLLPNPVPPPPQGNSDPERMKAALEETCRQVNPGYTPEGKTLLYPVRAIRRKNVLEAGLMAVLMKEPVNLIITLPGDSSQEKAYSDSVENAFKTGLIPGVWCPGQSGNPLLSYPNLATNCDGVISTSVQEGFGYLFLNALHWRKPLLARYLDILDDILGLYGEYPRRFWADFRVPLDKSFIQRTEQAYLRKIQEQSHVIPERVLKSLHSSVKKIAASGTMDISFLSVPDQLEILKKAKDASWRNEAVQLNQELLESVSCTLMADPPDMSGTLADRYSDGAFARTFVGILNSFGGKTPMVPAGKIKEAVYKAFGRIDYFRLLYDQAAATKSPPRRRGSGL